MKQKQVTSSIMLALAALIWGMAFVAQSVGMDYVGPFTFNACRFVIGGLVLIPCIFLLRKINKDKTNKTESAVESAAERKSGILGGICCGTALFAASAMQQIGIQYTTVGKAGFITALYIVIVPLVGLLLGKRARWTIWASVAIAVAGMYLLCMTEGAGIGKGDFYVFLGSVIFAGHILVIDHFSPKADGVFLSCVQCFTAGALAAVPSLLWENPAFSQILQAAAPILYAGVMSCGVAYTFQVIGQKHTDPTVASLILSLESVFSLLAGWVLLGQKLSGRELFGCVLVFAAILLAQLAPQEKEPVMEEQYE